MNKFKVGDYIKGNQNAFYGVTNEGMTRAKVIRILSDDDEDDIEIKILKHNTQRDQIGHTYSVNSEYFTLIDSSSDSSSESTKITSYFKVGDIIRGTKRGTMYSFTNVDMIRGEVVEVHNPEIRIKILDHKSFRSSIGNVYTARDGNVNNTFELIERKES